MLKVVAPTDAVPSVEQRLQAHRDRAKADRNRIQATAAAKPNCFSCGACFAKKDESIPAHVAIGIPVGEPFAAPVSPRESTPLRIEATSCEPSAETAAKAAAAEEAAAAARSARATQMAFFGIYDQIGEGRSSPHPACALSSGQDQQRRPCLVCSERRKFSRRKEDDTSTIIAEEDRAMMGTGSPRNRETGRRSVRFCLPCCGRPPPERQATRRIAPYAESESLFGDIFSLSCCTARSKGPADDVVPPKTGSYKRSVGFEMRNTDI
mmetsp:Transcript_25081/g.50923  ORF Transcript_25081/g.50923 Transcript_25081/m.50923 type:complete len:266 (+) Transcript_25081:29-826(+)